MEPSMKLVRNYFRIVYILSGYLTGFISQGRVMPLSQFANSFQKRDESSVK